MEALMSKKLLQNYVPIEEIAKDVGRHRRTVERWLNAGYLIGVKLGTMRLVDVVASRARLAALCNKANKTAARMPAK
jgi:hypothetical protein